jgi:FAD:protein FMN transferase
MNTNTSAKTSHFFQKEIKMEIMSCDVYIGIVENDSLNFPLNELEKDVDIAFAMFKSFEKKYSRFIKDNELYKFNIASGWLDTSLEIFELLELSVKYYKYTSGIFDISVYQNLMHEGYDKSLKNGSLVNYHELSSYKKHSVADLQFKDGKVYKPKGLLIEFGGLGKGYVVKKVSAFLAKKYKNFIIDAGGDIYFSGVDLKNGYNYWACDIENPTHVEKNLATLLISNKGVATSGINRRKWIINDIQKNHLINPKSGKSVPQDILSVTVVSNDIIFSDIMAKSLLIMGTDIGLDFCEKHKIAALYVDAKIQLRLSSKMKEHLWT